LVGTYRLDWIFVKPPKGEAAQALHPHHPRALFCLNTAPSEPISDHAPIVVQLAAPTAPAAASRMKTETSPTGEGTR
jgi:hypothetical protein